MFDLDYYKKLKNEYIKIHYRIRYLTSEDYRKYKKDHSKSYYLYNKYGVFNV